MTKNSSQNVSDKPRKLALGIDVGGSGIKGAVVDLETGEFATERVRIETPKPATPDAVAATIRKVADELGWEGPIGITLPGVVQNNRLRSAGNIDQAWLGLDLDELFARHLDGRQVAILNDADAAGLAEVAYGEDLAKKGAVLFLTLGTGIGSAFLLDGKLFPNTELGHMLVGDMKAEHQASSAVREREGLSFKKWAKRLNVVLNEYSNLFNPDVFIVGGGVSRKFDKWGPLLETTTPVLPAKLKNRAGIVGAAMAITDRIERQS
ncbi:polyphosphate glucokinase [Corynebacterium phocae]|uniref:Polyphosphate glucokinase n=1 Tax=Corynebacterium phocae TaxID=161895 RepID=A0A1L7D6F7_9CORY|nr:ROK family protein [Corynebacterium phocae]APT93685.1 polyphosphate glucokinase [Corynebacterium phocae]KAA8724993.1 ROK family protein [Corynebacterium phocae]